MHLKDHAPRIRAQQQQAEENAAMEDMEQRGAPLMWAMCVVALLTAADGLYGSWQQYAELAAQGEVMIQCLNGKAIGLGDAVLHCELREIKLVAGLHNDL